MNGFAARRILQEYQQLSNEHPSSENCFFKAWPLEDDLFEWHFTIKGPIGTPFEGGLYHGKILLPSEYPLKPPAIILLTPNGRFEVGQRICLTISSYHEETWQPSWGISTILLALCSLFPSKPEGIGSIDSDPEVQRKLSAESRLFRCEQCRTTNLSLFPTDNNLDCVSNLQSNIRTGLYGKLWFLLALFIGTIFCLVSIVVW
eukprot:jgi/Galph1/1074/GphlegSOOS_G5742.1